MERIGIIQGHNARHCADIELAKRICAGDQASEAQFVKEHIAWMRKLARQLVINATCADDAVQDAFANAFRALPKYEGRSSLKTWLHRITVNAALMKRRKSRQLRECDIDALMPEYDRYGLRVETPWPATETPEDIVTRRELRQAVIAGIARLPENYRNILHLRDIEGLDTATVAAQLSISESNVKVRLHRARSALKKLLESTAQELVS